jgi:hypothetical protein
MTATKPRVRGLIFSAPMVRALAAGRKTQTRRVVKQRGTPALAACLAPLQPCDVFYVRETWQAYKPELLQPTRVTRNSPMDLLPLRVFERNPRPGACVIEYAADGYPPGSIWRSPLHMPRWAARFWRRVTRVRLERVQDISQADAAAEGWPGPTTPGTMVADFEANTARYWFCEVWASLHRPPFAWGNNPWVWVYDFEPTEPIRESV